MIRNTTRIVAALVASLTLLLSVAPQPALAEARTFSSNRAYALGYMGCAFTLQHGQYGSSAYALIRNDNSGTGCQFFYVEVTTTAGPYDQDSARLPVNGVWLQADKPGTESAAKFVVSGTKYGLQCDATITVAANGAANIRYDKVSGTGNCPQQLAW